MERWCTRCGRPAVGMQSGAIVSEHDELVRWTESLCRSCIEAEERFMPPPPTRAEQAAAADLFLAQIREEALAAVAEGNTDLLRRLGPFLDDLANGFPQPIPDDLMALAAPFRVPGA